MASLFSPTPSWTPPLRVWAAPAPPWVERRAAAWTGVEVDAIRRFAHWAGREIEWVDARHGALPAALASGSADVGIGGVCANEGLDDIAHLLTFGRRPLTLGPPGHDAARAHVWAVRRSAGWLWVEVGVYLKLHRRGALPEPRRLTA